MIRRMAGVALILTLAACGYTPEEVREQPTRWSATYARQWDEITNCIAANQTREYQVVPTWFATERRATVTASQTLQGYSSMVWQYDIRAVPSGAEVSWRRRPAYVDIVGMEATAKQVADRCGAR